MVFQLISFEVARFHDATSDPVMLCVADHEVHYDRVGLREKTCVCTTEYIVTRSCRTRVPEYASRNITQEAVVKKSGELIIWKTRNVFHASEQ